MNQLRTVKKIEIMKTIRIFSAALIIASVLSTGCTKEFNEIDGIGPITTQTLQLDDFSKIDMTGIDDVVISYGPVQEVTVRGHANIIDRIRTEVINDTWYMELENGNYGEYELTYYLTLPVLEEVSINGTSDVFVTEFADQESLSVRLTGTGSFYGFPMKVGQCEIYIAGTGTCEVSVEESLGVSIEGSGHVYYKGSPVIREHISGTGSVQSSND